MNSVALTGRLTADPEIRTAKTANGDLAIARFTLAVDRHVARNNGEQTQTADFISCQAFGKRAEFLGKYGKKGTKFDLTGRIQTGSYTKQDGTKVYTTDVVAENIEFGESKSAASQRSGGGQTQAASQDGFMDIPDGVEAEGLPFN